MFDIDWLKSQLVSKSYTPASLGRLINRSPETIKNWINAGLYNTDRTKKVYLEARKFGGFGPYSISKKDFLKFVQEVENDLSKVKEWKK